MNSEFTPRQIWLYDRTLDCVKELSHISVDDWELYMEKCKTLAEELLYAVTEWEKYYKD